ncbi:hypothetical protein SteCoe_3145 [Stentor coeruleus]|uniref:Uncharacterized protein n=1 Tax=Stentor coeruleus TaxID=5963 RepID=A0A1R2CY00_9CILI|nr:hypothetical protein SteCoe_3145 [Stentor coeruleus]
MNFYVIDTSSLRVQNAMLNLGIEASELLKKVFEDFAAKDANEEIQIVRYNFFKRKQQELVRQIKEYIKEELMRGLEKTTQSKKQESSNNDFLITSLPYSDRKTVQRPKLNYRGLVSKALLEVKESINEKEALDKRLKHGQELREKAKSALAQSRMKFSELKEKQKLNLEKIRYNEQTNLSKLHRGYTSISPDYLSHKKKYINYSQTQSRNSSITEISIDDQMKKYEQKMSRSKQLHDLFTKNRKEAASKLLKRNLKQNTIINNEEKELTERLTKYVTKNKTAEIKRFEHRKQQNEYRFKLKEKHDERRIRAQTRIRERDVFYNERIKEIEKKMEITNGVIEKKNFDWKKELEIKNELQRLKDEEALSNAERKKRVMKFRRENVIEKQKGDIQRIEVMKKDREHEIKKKMDNARKTMREKERFREIMALLRRSPESRIMGKKSESFVCG